MAKRLACAAAVVGACVMHTHSAAACGGTFFEDSETPAVSGHRMVLSVGMESSTLWDQISYSGDPASFAWVLPIKGEVTVGLSSDGLFGVLEQGTNVRVLSPSLECPDSCGNGAGSGGGSDSGGGGGGPGGVDVLVQGVVGPYEMVQLSASEPAALSEWLASHNYPVPAQVQPTIDAYVAEGFDFLALKLVPGADVSAMKPVRVTSAGANPVLPLRMVAAGTGDVTPITLWVLAEGRYAPGNFASFEIGVPDLVWDWDTGTSNYSELRSAGLAANDGKTFLVETAQPYSAFEIQSQINDLVQYAEGGGYGGDTESPEAAAAEDLAALLGSIDEASLWVTRLYGALPHAALSEDLELQAAAQVEVPRDLYVTNTKGADPCPPDPCGGDAGSTSSAGGGNAGGSDAGPTGNGGAGAQGSSPVVGGGGTDARVDGLASEGSGCSSTGPSSGGAWVVAALGLARAAVRRRRTARSE